MECQYGLDVGALSLLEDKKFTPGVNPGGEPVREEKTNDIPARLIWGIQLSKIRLNCFSTRREKHER
jgi:hypothetical protein